MNDKEIRVGLWLRQAKYVRGYVWHRYYVAVNQVLMVTVKLCEMMTSLHLGTVG